MFQLPREEPYWGEKQRCATCLTHRSKGFSREFPDLNKFFFVCTDCIHEVRNAEFWFVNIAANVTGHTEATVAGIKLQYEGRDAEVLSQLTDDEFRGIKEHKTGPNREKNILITSNPTGERTMRFYVGFPIDDPAGNHILLKIQGIFPLTQENTVKMAYGDLEFEVSTNYPIQTYYILRATQMVCYWSNIDFQAFLKSWMNTIQEAILKTSPNPPQA